MKSFKLWALGLLGVLIVCACPAQAKKLSGQCGEHMTWQCDTRTKTLILSGYGETDKFGESKAPWYAYREKIQTVIIPEGLTNIDWMAFSGCYNLRNVEWNAIDCADFSQDNPSPIMGGPITSFTLGTNVKHIPDYLCQDLKYITSLSLGPEVQTIGKYAFCRCYNIKSLIIPESVTSIDTCAFMSCISLSTLRIPESVSFIGDMAFDGILNIEINYKDSTDGMLWGAQCANQYVDGPYAYSDSTKTTILGSNVTIPHVVTIPNNVTTIGRKAFKQNLALESVTILNPVIQIEESAFECCNYLKTAVVAGGVTAIEFNTFRYTALESVEIGSNVQRIEKQAFSMCRKLKSVTIHAEQPPTLNPYAFYKVPMNECVLYVPQGSIERYRNVDGWKEFMNIQPVK